MKFLLKLERKYGKYAVMNLTYYLIGCAVIGYFLSLLDGPIIQYLQFNPKMILSGQIWRLVTWIACPPTEVSIFSIFVLLMYYYAGKNLEYIWGAFNYNLYIFSGLLFNVIGAMMLYFITGLPIGIGTEYIYLSTLLAYFFMNPEQEVRVYFLIPIKMKWMGYIELAYIFVAFYNIKEIGIPSIVWGLRLQILFALLNFIIFMLMLRKSRRVTKSAKKNQKNFRYQVRQQKINSIKVHRCAVCGKTKDENPELEFRFCSKCKGNYEYCQNHLFTHSHVK